MSSRYHFFISYTGADSKWANRIRTWLKAAGYRVVMQEPDFAPGKNIVYMMHEALQRAEWVVAVLSPSYLASRWTREEWTAGMAKEHLLPVRVADFTPPGLFAALKYIDMAGKAESAAETYFIDQIKCAVAGANRVPSNEEVAALVGSSDSRPHQTAIGSGNILAGRDVHVHAHEKVRPRHVIQRGPDVISAATAREIQRIVRELVDTDMPKDPRKGFKKWHEFIKNKCHVQSYLEIPTAQADAIVGLLRQNLARVRSRLHRKGSAERHKDLYRTIWARARELGLSRPQVYALAADTLKLSRVPASLKELGGNQLESFYRFMLGRATGEGT